MRPPCVAGQFYELDKEKLINQIKKCFINVPKQNKKVFGVISPHAGYMYSGIAQAHSFSALAKADTYIVLGISHRGYENALSLEDFSTPLGIAKNDIDLQNQIQNKTNIEVNENIHMFEHSLEVQMPFLKFLYPEAKICPIIISKNYSEIAQNLCQVIRESDKTIKIIASSDFTHFGPAYNYTPFSDNAKEKMRELDGGALNLINKLDASAFLSYIKKTGATICGKYPIATLLEMSKIAGYNKGTTLKYYTSSDITGDYTNAVGYASVMIE